MRAMSAKTATLVLALAAALSLGRAARAQVSSSDSLTINIAPNAYYALEIDTSTMLMNLGNVDLGQSTHTVTPATVTVHSTYAQTDLKLTGQIDSSGAAWTFDGDTSSGEADKLAVWAVFTDTGVFVHPTGLAGAFDGTTPAASNADVVSASIQDVGDGGGFTGRFVLSSSAPGYRSMEDIPAFAADPAGSRSKLWLKLRLPPSTTSNAAQNITITLTAGAPN